MFLGFILMLVSIRRHTAPRVQKPDSQLLYKNIGHIHLLMLGSFNLNLTHAKVIQEEETTIEKMPPTDQVVDESVRHFLSELWRRI